MAYKKKNIPEKDGSVSLDFAEKLLDGLEKEMARSDMLFSMLVFALAKLNEPVALPLNLGELRDKDVPFFITIDKEKRIAACRIVVDEVIRKKIVDLSNSISRKDIDNMFEPETKH